MGGQETKEQELVEYAVYLWQKAQMVKAVTSLDEKAEGYLFGSLARFRRNLTPEISLGEHRFSLNSDADVLIQPSSKRAFLALCSYGDDIFRNLPLQLDLSMALTREAPFIKRASQYWIQLF